MQKPYILFSTTILVSILAACVGSPRLTENITVQESPTPTVFTSPTPATSVSNLNCLSPALHMNAERAAHTVTRLPDGKVLIAGGFREEGTSEIAIASAEIFDPGTNTFMSTSDMTAPRNGHTATLLPNGKVLLAGG